MLVDANLLLFAINPGSPFHAAAKRWLEDQLNGPRRIGLPWQSLGAVVRIATHQRAFDRPLSPSEAWNQVAEWLGAPTTWIPEPGKGFEEIAGRIIADHDVRGNVVPDALLAALALEHGLTVCSADSDFARFTGVRWENPLSVT